MSRRGLRKKIWRSLREDNVQEFKSLVIGSGAQKKVINELAFSKSWEDTGLVHEAICLNSPQIFNLLLTMPYLMCCNLFEIKTGFADAVRTCLMYNKIEQFVALEEFAEHFGKEVGHVKLPKHLKINFFNECSHCIEMEANESIRYLLQRNPRIVVQRNSEKQTLLHLAALKDNEKAHRWP